MTSDRCYRSLAEGKHGVGVCPLEPRKGHGLIRDEIPGGQWFENGFSQPQKFYSHSEHRAALDREGMMIAPRYVEGSKHLTRWAAVDLRGAEEFIKRHYPQLPSLDERPCPVRVEATDETFTVEAGE
jgi:hypothetical protein